MKELYEKLGQIQFQLDDLLRLKEDLIVQLRLDLIKAQTQKEFTGMTEVKAE